MVLISVREIIIFSVLRFFGLRGRSVVDLSSIKCKFCREMGHYKGECPKLVGKCPKLVGKFTPRGAGRGSRRGTGFGRGTGKESNRNGKRDRSPDTADNTSSALNLTAGGSHLGRPAKGPRGSTGPPQNENRKKSVGIEW